MKASGSTDSHVEALVITVTFIESATAPSYDDFLFVCPRVTNGIEVSGVMCISADSCIMPAHLFLKFLPLHHTGGRFKVVKYKSV